MQALRYANLLTVAYGREEFAEFISPALRAEITASLISFWSFARHGAFFETLTIADRMVCATVSVPAKLGVYQWI
jgi:hypothetical protein